MLFIEKRSDLWYNTHKQRKHFCSNKSYGVFALSGRQTSAETPCLQLNNRREVITSLPITKERYSNAMKTDMRNSYADVLSIIMDEPELEL